MVDSIVRTPVKSKILVVSGFLPSLNVPSGGQKLVYDEIRRLSESHRVTLLAFCNEHEKAFLRLDDFSFCEKSKIFSIGRRARLGALLRFPRLPLVASSRFLAAAKWLEQELKTGGYEKAVFEFIQVGELCRLASKSIATNLVVHDLFHQAIGRRSANAKGVTRVILGWEARRTKRWEEEILRTAGAVATLTQKDCATIREMSGRTDVSVRYPVKHLSAGYRRDPGTIEKNTILFFGQMSRDENADGVRWFAEKMLPLIRLKVPDAMFIIAGANPSPSVLNLAGKHVRVTGFIEDPEKLFAATDLAVAPLRLGAGIKIKVVEYIAAGIPTVATTVGAEGIEESPLLSVADNQDEFVNACVRILSKKT